MLNAWREFLIWSKEEIRHKSECVVKVNSFGFSSSASSSAPSSKAATHIFIGGLETLVKIISKRQW